MERLARDYPELKFGKALAFGNANLKDEVVKLSYPFLKKNFYKNCEFIFNVTETRWSKSTSEQRFNLLTKFRDVLIPLRKDGNDLFLINSSGNSGQREAILLLSRILGVIVFDSTRRDLVGRYKYANPKTRPPYQKVRSSDDPYYKENTFYIIPAKQIDCIVREITPSSKFLKLYHSSARNNYPSDDFLMALSEIKLEKCAAIDYAQRWVQLTETYRVNKSLYEALKSKVKEVLSDIFQDKSFVVPPKITEPRTKDEFSLWNKLLLKESENGKYIDDPFDRFSDVVGFRVEFSNQQDMDIGIDILKKSQAFFNKDGNKEINIESRAKKLGYRAEHADLKLRPKHCHSNVKLKNIVFEIQLKTSLASTWSEMHHKMMYKAKRSAPLSEKELKVLESKFKKAARLLEQSDSQLMEICKEYVKS